MLSEIMELITKEADQRLCADAHCSGGYRAKLHSVLMEVGLEVGKLMEEDMLRAKNSRHQWNLTKGD